MDLSCSATAPLSARPTKYQCPDCPGTNWIDDEHIGQALLILMLSTSAKRFEKSSRRLEFLTWGLLGLTIALLVPTLVSVFR